MLDDRAEINRSTRTKRARPQRRIAAGNLIFLIFATQPKYHSGSLANIGPVRFRANGTPSRFRRSVDSLDSVDSVLDLLLLLLRERKPRYF